MIISALKWELDKIDLLLSLLTNDKTRLRKTSIVARTEKGNKYYYLRYRKNKKYKKQYLGTKDSPRLLKAASNNYRLILKNTLRFDSDLLKKFLSEFKAYDYSSIRAKLSRSLSTVEIPNPADELLSKLYAWKNAPYEKNTYEFPDSAIYAKDGTRVRSRIECIIYNALCDAGIPFRYDPLLDFKTVDQYGNTVIIKKSPDFLIRCPDGSYIIWEHAGCIDKDDYTVNLAEKIKLYHYNGYTLGDNFFITSEDKDGGVNTQTIDNIITMISWKVFTAYEC